MFRVKILLLVLVLGVSGGVFAGQQVDLSDAKIVVLDPGKKIMANAVLFVVLSFLSIINMSSRTRNSSATCCFAKPNIPVKKISKDINKKTERKAIRLSVCCLYT